MLFKWIFDRVVAFIGMVFLLPVYLIVACLIKIKMPEGKVLFRQKRVGKNGDLFTMYKFRTMSSEPQKNVSVSAAEKNRITPLGHKLRKYKLDELPELPRPDVPGYADKLLGEDSEILKLRPGITGPASLKYRDEEEILETVDNPIEYNNKVIYPDKIRINLYYYRNYSFLKDIQMIFCTVLGTKMKYNGEVI